MITDASWLPLPLLFASLMDSSRSGEILRRSLCSLFDELSFDAARLALTRKLRVGKSATIIRITAMFDFIVPRVFIFISSPKRESRGLPARTFGNDRADFPVWPV